MDEDNNLPNNGHEPTNNPFYDYQQLWYSPTKEEYREMKEQNPFYDGDREMQFANIFGGEIEYVVQHIVQPEVVKQQHEILTGTGEFKTEEEHQWGKWGNLFIEIEQQFKLPFNGEYSEWQKSGLSKTKANVWIHQCFSNGAPHLPFVIPTDTLRSWIMDNNFAEFIAEHEYTSQTRNRGVLIPIEFVLQHYPLPVNNQQLRKRLEEVAERETYNKQQREERLKQYHQRAREILSKTKLERVYGEDVDVETHLDGTYFVTYNSSNGEVFTQWYSEDWQPINK